MVPVIIEEVSIIFLFYSAVMTIKNQFTGRPV
ncbi:hypothetical protein KPNJ1_02165 [Klebsiella pneumoniae 30660/NJST258_1]|uniref:Uncharacterized protein n=1 Tax=Klebsiella pneumoniae 30684/NJST258_2 TaxID=1420013 RepID=W8UG59_KLEPN|nr:hypothetical protein KPNJ2_02124 [Klebsiella pneumoniae 30684/NJST258_2]AHM84571.1 hypothetical protein KPNJ1_02165 [Klebsiella pneumoniae 30660/NJST258_1]